MNKIISFLSIIILMSSCNIHKTIYVADYFADCDDTTSQNCLNIKEAQEDEWTVLHNGIEGFEYNEGYTYKMEVRATKIKNPQANETPLKYKLIKVIYKEKSNISEEKLVFNGKWKVSKLIGMEGLKKFPTLNIDLEATKIGGNAGCNTYGADFSIEGDQLKFGIPIATKMMCTNMNIEKAFFGCLQNISYYKLVDGELNFYSKDGKEQMTCQKVEE